MGIAFTAWMYDSRLEMGDGMGSDAAFI